MGSPVRDHMLTIWQLHWAFLSVSWMMFKNKLYKDKKISIFKNKTGSCPCHAVLCWCSLKSSPPFRFYYRPCVSDSSFDREVFFLDYFFRWYLLVSKTQDRSRQTGSSDIHLSFLLLEVLRETLNHCVLWGRSGPLGKSHCVCVCACFYVYHSVSWVLNHRRFPVLHSEVSLHR